jgi:hypothetical protein
MDLLNDLVKNSNRTLDIRVVLRRQGTNKIMFKHQIALGLLVGWLGSNVSSQAVAADLSIGNGGLRFNRDTPVESTFLESHGAYQSTFGVLNLDTHEKTPLLIETNPSDNPESILRPSTKLNDRGTKLDFLETPGNAVPNFVAKFTFKANNSYVFYLESTFRGHSAGTVYSTDTLNPSRERQVVFTGTPTDLCTPGGMTMAWDDTGAKLVRTRQQQDRDFDDFIVRLKGTACSTGSPGTVGAVPSVVGGGGNGGLIGLGILGLGGALLALSGSSLNAPASAVPPKAIPTPTLLPSFAPASAVPPKAIPTPALLPGLIGMGVAAFRKRRQA